MADRLRLFLMPALVATIVATIWAMAWMKQLQAERAQTRRPTHTIYVTPSRNTVTSIADVDSVESP